MKLLKQGMKPRTSHIILGLTSTGILLIGLACWWSVSQTRLTLTAARQLEFDQAAVHARQAQPLVSFLNTLTGHQFKSVRAWDQGLRLVQTLPEAGSEVEFFQPSTEGTHSQPKVTVTQLINQSLEVAQLARSSWLLRLIQPDAMKHLTLASQDLTTLNQSLLTGNHTYVLVFQNTDEIRATGGFMGSYATVKLKEGQIADFTIQDIYQPDGQFTGYVEAPPGVKEFLSSGNGLRLPDANWWPDFPSSAQKMLPFFGLGQEKAVEGIIAVNLTVAEKILQVTGPVFLPDYQTTVDASNIAQVARADRAEFFPGSQSKPHFLSSLFKQLTFKLDELSPDQKKELLRYFVTSLQTKNIQLYANDQGLLTVFDRYGVSGQATAKSAGLSVFLVESNIGINKANRGIQRSVKLDVSDYRTNVQVTFTNDNQTKSAPQAKPLANSVGADHLHYLNYQRILVPPTVEVKNISVQGVPVTDIDQAIITTYAGEQLNQVGFLVEVPELQTATVAFELHHQPLVAHPTLWIQKQSGLPPTPYSVLFNGQSRDLLLEKDELIEL